MKKIRDSKGRFVKGLHSSPKTEFKKDQHWRNSKSYWKKEWLQQEYSKGKSLEEIASAFNVGDSTIEYFMKKFGIKTRTMSEIRSKKYWGSKGKSNPMFGKFGKLNPNWNGGHSPERQSKYARFFWKELKKFVLKRDNYTCQICFVIGNLIVHHIFPWSKYPSFRFNDDNLVTVCIPCHKKLHGKRR